MIVLKLFRQLKKKLRRKLRWLTLGFFGLIVAALVIVALNDHRTTGDASNADQQTRSAFLSDRTDDLRAPQKAILNELKRDDRAREVFLRKIYICGEELQRLGTLSPNEVEELLRSHPQAEVALQGDEQVYLSEKADGPSSACKDGAYFGVDETGTLSLFNGLPERNEVIRTFFQLNIQFLKSALPGETVERLYKGIYVADRDEYNSVLSTFADYAITDSERASAPAGTSETKQAPEAEH